MIRIFQLKTADATTLKHINHLLRQLSRDEKKITLVQLRTILKQPIMVVLVAKENGVIVGMASMYLVHLLSGPDANVEDVVVDEAMRGRGIATMLMNRLIAIATKKKAGYIDLTSRPERVAANELYKKLGFKLRTTNVYRLSLQK